MSENLVPAGNVQIDGAGGYPFATGQPNIRELFYGVAQLAGESQGFDGNGPFVRFQAGGGPQLVRMPNPLGGSPPARPSRTPPCARTTSTRRSPPARGSRCRPSPGRVTPPPFRMDVPCHTQALPEINDAAPVGPPEPGGGAMRRAIREHLRDFVAIFVLLVTAIVTTGIILASQTTLLPSWVPFIGDDKFELKAEFSSAQAVTPGQGQTVTIAGINVGQVSGSELDSGRAIVTMQVDHKYAELIHPDATLLLRPRTGLQDMTIEVDPGTDGEPVEEGTTLPLASSQPNVQPDQIFASLDGDTRSFLQLLLEAAGKGLEGDNGRKLAAGLKRF